MLHENVKILSEKLYSDSIDFVIETSAGEIFHLMKCKLSDPPIFGELVLLGDYEKRDDSGVTHSKKANLLFCNDHIDLLLEEISI